MIGDACDLGIACQGLQLTTVRNGSEILKLVQLSQKDRQITVRLLPATDPEKTTGVKQVMALIATQLHECTAGSHFGKTNLQEFLQ